MMNGMAGLLPAGSVTPTPEEEKNPEYLKELQAEKDNLESATAAEEANNSEADEAGAGKTSHAIKLLEQGKTENHLSILNRGETGTNFLDGVKVACFKIFCLQRHLYAKFSDRVLVQKYSLIFTCL